MINGVEETDGDQKTIFERRNGYLRSFNSL